MTDSTVQPKYTTQSSPTQPYLVAALTAYLLWNINKKVSILLTLDAHCPYALLFSLDSLQGTRYGE